MLHESQIRAGSKVHIEQAVFKQKGTYRTRETKKKDKLKELQIKAKQKQSLGWDNEQQGEGLSIIILENFFNLDSNTVI